MKQADRLRHWLSLLMHGETGGMVPSAEKTLQEILELFGGEAGGPHPPSAEHTLVEIRDLLTGGVGTTPAEVWAFAIRALTDFSAEELFDLPVVDDYYGVIEPLSSAVANTFGASVQISADVGVGKRLLHVDIAQTANTVTGPFQLEMRDASGAGGSLVGRVNLGAMRSIDNDHVPLWVALADNSALHVRVRDGVASAQRFPIGVQIA